VGNGSNRTQEYKDKLRAKFVEQAHTYIGVPYARRYEAEGVAESPLYLDCCALVRKCVLDLKDEFGFVVAKWNQAYQMDTLPIRYDDISQMKRGDLIFYEVRTIFSLPSYLSS
jgi:hypothetical protein